ncbi:hypothetical protein HanPI659440_Chr10g0376061 [Helianthus annuus]|nr:hypothetical protein HanPI659440_Chr10g0376061 [Helianthus annuus]
MNFAVMSALDFVKSDDTSDVVFMDAQAAEGNDAVARGSKQRFEDVGYVSVPNVKGFTKTAEPKAFTRRSARCMLKSAAQSTFSDPMEFSDDIEVSEGQGPDADKEKNLVVLGKKKASCTKVPSVKVEDSFKDASVCADVLANFVPPGVRGAISEMEGDTMLSRLMLSSCNLSALVAKGVTRFRKGMQEYEEFSKKKEKMKASVAAMKRTLMAFRIRKKLGLRRLKLKADREALDVQKTTFTEEKEGLKASIVQATGDNQWLIEQGFQQVVTYLLHSNEFNFALGEVYTKLQNYGKHLGLIASFKLHESGQALEQSPMFRFEASEIFKESVQLMERLTYPYVSEVSSCFVKPLSVLHELKLAGLNEKVCAEVLDSLSKKRSRSGDSEETFSEDANLSKEASLEGSAVEGDGGPKVKKEKKAKKGKSDGSGASKPSADV